MASVQFRSAEMALQAFGNTDCEAWSVWQGKQLLYKGIGDEDLKAFFDLLEDQASNAVYTLCYYEDITSKKNINSKTPFDGSFNFRLNSDRMEITQAQYSKVGSLNELQSKVSAMENRIGDFLDKLENREEEEPEPPNRLGIIGDILEHPAIAPLLPQLLAMVTGTNKQIGYANQINGKQAVNGDEIPGVVRMGAVGAVSNVPPAITDKTNQAIERLQLVDPNLSDHLTMLANLAEKDPGTFQLLLSSLENMAQ